MSAIPDAQEPPALPDANAYDLLVARTAVRGPSGQQDAARWARPGQRPGGRSRLRDLELERGRSRVSRASPAAFMALAGSWRSDRVRLEQRLGRVVRRTAGRFEDARRTTTVTSGSGRAEDSGPTVFLSYARSDLTWSRCWKGLLSRGVNVWRTNGLRPSAARGRAPRCIRGRLTYSCAARPGSLQRVGPEIAYALDRERWYRTHRGTEKPVDSRPARRFVGGVEDAASHSRLRRMQGWESIRRGSAGCRPLRERQRL
jgi:hypothetical protein